MDALHRHNIQNAMGQPRRPLTQVELIDTYDEVPKERVSVSYKTPPLRQRIYLLANWLLYT